MVDLNLNLSPRECYRSAGSCTLLHRDGEIQHVGGQNAHIVKRIRLKQVLDKVAVCDEIAHTKALTMDINLTQRSTIILPQ